MSSRAELFLFCSACSLRSSAVHDFLRQCCLCLQAATSSNFAHVCIRKMYVLCSRDSGGSDPDGCLLEVSRLALPVFLARCDAVLRAYAEDQARPATTSQSTK